MEMEKELEHNKIDCLLCIHKSMCILFNVLKKNSSIISNITEFISKRGDYRKIIECANFKHKKYKMNKGDYKNMLIERINKTDISGKYLFLINHMLDLAEGK